MPRQYYSGPGGGSGERPLPTYSGGTPSKIPGRITTDTFQPNTDKGDTSALTQLSAQYARGVAMRTKKKRLKGTTPNLSSTAVSGAQKPKATTGSTAYAK
jgi:hypothetical protein